MGEENWHVRIIRCAMQPHSSTTIQLFSQLIRGLGAGEAVWSMGDGEGGGARLADVQGEVCQPLTSGGKGPHSGTSPCNLSVAVRQDSEVTRDAALGSGRPVARPA